MKRKVSVPAMARRLGFEEAYSRSKDYRFGKRIEVNDLDGDTYIFDMELRRYEGSYLVLLGSQFIGRTSDSKTISQLVRAIERVAGCHVKRKLRLTMPLP